MNVHLFQEKLSDGPRHVNGSRNKKTRIHHEGTKDTKVFAGCASRTGQSRIVSRKGRQEKNLLTLRSWRLGASKSPIQHDSLFLRALRVLRGDILRFKMQIQDKVPTA